MSKPPPRDHRHPQYGQQLGRFTQAGMEDASLQLSGAVRRPAFVDMRGNVEFALVRGHNSFLESFGGIRAKQRDRASAESASRPCANP